MTKFKSHCCKTFGAIWESRSHQNYPNPAADYAIVDYQFSGNNQEVKIAFYNVLGTVVKEIDLDRDDRSAKISLRELNSGLYMYQLLVDGKPVATKKLMVRKQ